MLGGRKRPEAVWRRLWPRRRRMQNRQSCDSEQGPGRTRGTWGGLSYYQGLEQGEGLPHYLFSVVPVSRRCSAVKDPAAFSPQGSDATCLLQSPAGGPRCRRSHHELQREEECPVHSLSPRLLLRGTRGEKHLQHGKTTAQELLPRKVSWSQDSGLLTALQISPSSASQVEKRCL